jgi:hypothetical protein
MGGEQWGGELPQMGNLKKLTPATKGKFHDIYVTKHIGWMFWRRGALASHAPGTLDASSNTARVYVF